MLPTEMYECGACRWDWRTRYFRRFCAEHEKALASLTPARDLAFVCAPGDSVPGGAVERVMRTEGPAPLPVDVLTATPATVRGLDLDDE